MMIIMSDLHYDSTAAGLKKLNKTIDRVNDINYSAELSNNYISDIRSPLIPGNLTGQALDNGCELFVKGFGMNGEG